MLALSTTFGVTRTRTGSDLYLPVMAEVSPNEPSVERPLEVVQTPPPVSPDLQVIKGPEGDGAAISSSEKAVERKRLDRWHPFLMGLTTTGVWWDRIVGEQPANPTKEDRALFASLGYSGSEIDEIMNAFKKRYEEGRAQQLLLRGSGFLAFFFMIVALIPGVSGDPDTQWLYPVGYLGMAASLVWMVPMRSRYEARHHTTTTALDGLRALHASREQWDKPRLQRRQAKRFFRAMQRLRGGMWRMGLFGGPPTQAVRQARKDLADRNRAVTQSVFVEYATTDMSKWHLLDREVARITAYLVRNEWSQVAAMRPAAPVRRSGLKPLLDRVPAGAVLRLLGAFAAPVLVAWLRWRFWS